MNKSSVSFEKLEATMNLLTARIKDLDAIIAAVQRRGHSLELYDLKNKRKRYVKSLSKVVKRRLELEFECSRATEYLKMLVPEYLGMPCADYKVPDSLIKYIKLDYKNE